MIVANDLFYIQVMILYEQTTWNNYNLIHKFNGRKVADEFHFTPNLISIEVEFM